VNDAVHKQMVQDALAKKFGSHERLLCKYEAQYPQQAEREFQRVTNAYIRLLNELLKKYLPEIRDAARLEREGTRHDDTSDLVVKVKAVFDQMAGELERSTSGFGLYDKITAMAKLTRKLSIKEWKRAVKATLGIDLLDDYYTGELYRELMRKWVEDNVGLIKTIPQESLGRMREIVLEGYMNGETTTSIVKKIQKAYSTDRRHAQLLARDQIAKLNGQITQKQQEDAGVDEYIWSDSGDGRVRPGHKRLNGKRFRWNDPPVVDEKTGRRCHPGEDYECRCVALPVFNRHTVDLPMAGKVVVDMKLMT
jgi:SPP1 gp7 family putative phage head morphogenesis protein